MNPVILFDNLNILRQISLDEAKSKAGLNLAAYEGCLSKIASSFLNSPLNEKYHLGIAGYRELENEFITKSSGLSRMSLPGVTMLEKLANKTALKMFNAKHVDMRPLSGIHASICILCTFSSPGDLVLSIAPEHGGHGSTQTLLTAMGRQSSYLPWSEENSDIDIQKAAKLCDRKRPKLILIDLSATLFPLSIQQLRNSLSDKIVIAYDGSHVLGLIAGSLFPNPLVEGADVLYGNTHKSFPGPQKGILFFKNKDAGLKASKSIGKFLISSQHTGDTLALYISILEMEAYGHQFAKTIIENAKSLAANLEKVGLSPIRKNSHYTESGTFWMTPPKTITNHEACRILSAGAIFTNARKINGKNLIRIGTQYVTRQGISENQIERIASFFKRLLLTSEDPENIQKEVQLFMSDFRGIEFSFDKYFYNNS